MNLNIIDTFPQIKEYQKNNTSFLLNTWKVYADRISPSLYGKCYANASEYTFESDVLPVVNDALYHHFERIESAHQAITKIAEFLPTRASVLFHESLDITIIFYLGLCNGAGWATTLDGKQTILLGAEKIAELGWHETNTMCDLVCHEAMHLIHFALRNDTTRPEKAVWQLYTEGFATRYSQKLYQEGFYHQDLNGWLEFCKRHIADIKSEYLRRLKSNKDTSDFFGDWNSVMGQSNLGYYLGCEFIRSLEKSMSANEIACLSAEVVKKKLYVFLEELFYLL